MYQVRILDAASRELSRLDKQTGLRIVKWIRWLAKNLATVRPIALKRDLAGLYKLRVGDYRVVYELLHKEEVVVVHLIGHRREICQR